MGGFRLELLHPARHGPDTGPVRCEYAGHRFPCLRVLDQGPVPDHDVVGRVDHQGKMHKNGLQVLPPPHRTRPARTCSPCSPKPRSGRRHEEFPGREPHLKRRTTRTGWSWPRSPGWPASSGCAPRPQRREYREDGESAVPGPGRSPEGCSGPPLPHRWQGQTAPRRPHPRPGPWSLEGCRPPESGSCPDKLES
jgi:hypothetical protein